MGAAAIYVGLAYESMPDPSGWQGRLSVELQSYGHMVTEALSWFPGWADVIVLLIVVVLLARRALRQVKSGPDDGEELQEKPEKERVREYRN
jgi:hypothetical protein